jgi:hypothetical protein
LRCRSRLRSDGPWESWLDELKGPRKAAFNDMNARLGLTRHEAYLQPAPDGNYLVIVVQDGPGGYSFTEKLLSSDNEFDRWFAATVADLHGIDPAWSAAAGAHALPVTTARRDHSTAPG